MQWYYISGENREGPFSDAEFNARIESGEIDSETLVWNETFTDWVKFSEIDYKGLVAEFIEIPDSACDKSISEPDIKVPEELRFKDLDERNYKIDFSGTGGEYFRIWIVNLFLTIITLGIYAAWAKVRTRQYFYATTTLDGQSFDYLANPAAILKGNLIIAFFFIAYNLSNVFAPVLGIAIVVLFLITLPLLLYKSLRFFAHNTAYRNIRFRFTGTIGESYKTYMLIPILTPFTFGILGPYWYFRQKKYFFSNMSFGSETNEFTGRPGYFYKIFMILVLSMIPLFIIIFGVTSGLAFMNSAGNISGDEANMAVIPVLIGLYIVMLFATIAINLYIYVRFTNYCWENTTVGPLKFKSSMELKRFFWIRLTNILAIIFTFGLYIPWAKVRKYRYIADNIEVITNVDFENFSSSISNDESAIGDSAADFFDLEIGL